MTGNDKRRKENQALLNEIEELKNKLQKVLFIFLQSATLSNSLRFLFLLDNCVIHVLVLPRHD